MQELGGGFAAALYLEGQYANATLLEIHRFRSTGFAFNGAYPIGSLSGDSGAEGKLELSYYMYNIPELAYLRLFTYFSKIKVWNRRPNASEFSSESAKGGVLGLQVLSKLGLSAILQYGYPFDGPVGGESINPQIGFSLSYKF